MKALYVWLLVALECGRLAVADGLNRTSALGDCPALAPRATGPRDVHDLRVDDIKVVMALGDSISAGFAAKRKSVFNPMQTYEFRGVSYAAGGDPGACTLPNMFLRYQPMQQGASVGQHPAEVCYGLLCPPSQRWPTYDRFNVAQSGAMARNLPRQAEYLVRQLRSNPHIDFANDWKFLNLQIGSNDLCLACTSMAGGFSPADADTYEQSVREALQLVRNNIPRVFVNLCKWQLLGNFRVTDVYRYGRRHPRCTLMQSLPMFSFECACALRMDPLGEEARRIMDEQMQVYNERLQKIYDDYQREADPQFTVNLQLFETDLTSFPSGALSYFDCFHPSESTHAYLAKTAW
ncbi:GDSL lipase/esterase [Thamnocephalis sphaerospora]|uniref:GDSL lipase/esterase n=1 Tax=Thamnocephalis sphaerospora TaxID=78915 RepID=A0A4P9XLK8_9FUNG|nr:GDSL lipase/esterase [Thamnocephalis sphaerospora]|eukprot:RKP06758.1 GDSL lipase/esterase [Thamnocephalis sphaerospora]